MGTPIDFGSVVTTSIKTLYRDLPVGIGTGFFRKFKEQTFLMTSWHIVTGRHSETLRPLHSKCALPDRLKLLVGCRGNIGEWMEVDCALYEDASENGQPAKSIWLEHAIHGHKVDVVAVPIIIPEDAEVYTIDSVDTEPRMVLKVARDVFVLGYPLGISGGRGFPIWKRASLATEPGINLDGLPKILIDTATREGMSGAPVIAIADSYLEREDGSSLSYQGMRGYRFVGVYSGRLGDDEMQAQLGIVWKAAVIDHILQAPTKGKSSFRL